MDRLPLGTPGMVGLPARTAPSGDRWEHLGLAVMVSVALDGLLPQEMGFLERVIVSVSVSSLVLLIGQAVANGQQSLEVTRDILSELEAFRAFQITRAMDQDQEQPDRPEGE